MAIVNRFTKTRDTGYIGRTLQDLMQVPAYMRGQHDILNKAIMDYDTALAQSDSLDFMGDRLQEEQKKLYDKLAEQRNTLESEGFSQSAKSDFMRFNKEYQTAIGPRGIIGKIGDVKAQFEKSTKQTLVTALALKNDPRESQKRIDEEYARYKERFEETGKIENFVAPLPPGFEDLEVDLRSRKNLLGHTITTEKGKQITGGYDISIDPTTGMLVIRTMSGQIIKKTRNKQLDAVLKDLNNKWLDPEGAGYKSAIWNGMSIENIQEAILQGIEMMRIDETRDTTRENISVMKPPKTVTPPGPSKITVVMGDSTNAFGPNVAGLEDVQEKINIARDASNIVETARLDKILQDTIKEYEKETAVGQAYLNNKESLNLGGAIKDFQTLVPEHYYAIGTGGAINRAILTNDWGSDQLLDAINKTEGAFIRKEDEDGPYEGTFTLFGKGGGRIGGNIPSELINIARGLSSSKKQYDMGLDKYIAAQQYQNIGYQFKFLKGPERKVLEENLNDNVLQDAGNHFIIRHSSTVDKVGKEEVNFESGTASDSEKGSTLFGLIERARHKGEIVFDKFVPSNANGIPQLEFSFMVGGEGEKAILHKIALEFTEDKLDGPLGSTSQTLVDAFSTYGEIDGQMVANHTNQVRKFRNIKPSVSPEEEWKFSDRIKAKIPLGSYIQKKLAETGLIEFDIQMVNKPSSVGKGYDYIFQMQDSEGSSTTMNWSMFLSKVEGPNTKLFVESIAEMSPSVTGALIQRIKEMTTKDTIKEATEKEIDEALQYLADENVPLTFESHLQLMSFVTSTN